jgi:Pentapeptide repeats (8 copies)
MTVRSSLERNPKVACGNGARVVSRRPPPYTSWAGWMRCDFPVSQHVPLSAISPNVRRPCDSARNRLTYRSALRGAHVYWFRDVTSAISSPNASIRLCGITLTGGGALSATSGSCRAYRHNGARRDANLRDANLSRAELYGANLTNADLRGHQSDQRQPGQRHPDRRSRPDPEPIGHSLREPSRIALRPDPGQAVPGSAAEMFSPRPARSAALAGYWHPRCR